MWNSFFTIAFSLYQPYNFTFETLFYNFIPFHPLLYFLIVFFTFLSSLSIALHANSSNYFFCFHYFRIFIFCFYFFCQFPFELYILYFIYSTLYFLFCVSYFIVKLSILMKFHITLEALLISNENLLVIRKYKHLLFGNSITFTTVFTHFHNI